VNILLKSIKIMSKETTIKELLENKKSIARFGDGEFKIIFGRNIWFQRYNETLKKRLLDILKSNKSNLLVGIVRLVNNKNKFWVDFIEQYKFEFAKILNKN
jgi:hypothetical protein